MSPFGVVCQKCGAGMPTGVQYCGSCGTSISDEAAPPKPEARAPQRTAGVGMLLVTWGLGLVAGFLLGRAFAPGAPGAIGDPAGAPSVQQQPAGDAAESTESLLSRGRAAADAGEFARARDLFEQALARRPEDAAARVDLGIARLALGDEAGAREAFETALLADPPHPAAAYNLGLLEEEAGRLDAARPHYARYLALAPSGPNAGHARAMLGRSPREAPGREGRR